MKLLKLHKKCSKLVLKCSNKKENKSQISVLMFKQRTNVLWLCRVEVCANSLCIRPWYIDKDALMELSLWMKKMWLGKNACIGMSKSLWLTRISDLRANPSSLLSINFMATKPFSKIRNCPEDVALLSLMLKLDLPPNGVILIDSISRKLYRIRPLPMMIIPMSLKHIHTCLYMSQVILGDYFVSGNSVKLKIKPWTIGFLNQMYCHVMQILRNQLSERYYSLVMVIEWHVLTLKVASSCATSIWTLSLELNHSSRLRKIKDSVSQISSLLTETLLLLVWVWRISKFVSMILKCLLKMVHSLSSLPVVISYKSSRKHRHCSPLMQSLVWLQSMTFAKMVLWWEQSRFITKRLQLYVWIKNRRLWSSDSKMAL